MPDLKMMLADIASRLPSESPALTFYRSREAVGRMSYGELLAATGRIASYLQTERGVRPADRILILSPNRLEIPALLLAIFSLGAVAVPLNPTSEAADWAYIARHSDARGIVGTPDLLARLGTPVEFSIDVEKLAGLPRGSDAVAAGDLSRELALVLYTSGTTGNPKGVGLCQENLIYNGQAMAGNFRLAGATQFAVLPLYHAHALGFGLMTALATGGHLVFTEKLDPFAWSEIIAREKVRFTSVVPTLLPLLLAARVEAAKVPSLEGILVSSAPLSAKLAREFEARTGIRLVQGWGLSEYTNFACCLSPFDAPAEHQARLLDPEVPSIGPALPGTELRVVDPNGHALGAGETGELWVRGPSRMLGYYKDEANTRAAFDGEWLRTGDQGHFVERAGQAIYFITGRIKEIIIRSGEKLSPLGIERRLLAACPELEGRIVVLGFAHQTHGEEVGLYAEKPGELLGRLVSAIATLPLELRPKVLLHGDAPISRTHTGKVQRREMQAWFAAYERAQGALKVEAR